MRVRRVVLGMIFAGASSLPSMASDPSGNLTHEQQLRWWVNQRFGMFIHWGPVSQIGEELSWSRGYGPPPILPYDTLYKTFNPTAFNAAEWVAVARSAGMNYIVFVTKHADGFCEFNTSCTDYKITGPECPFQRDVTKELADACHADGMGLGFYYSPADWYVGDNSSPAHLECYTHQVVDELLSNYGRVDVLWFDLRPIGADETTLVNRMREKQPWILINNRGDITTLWDFRTPEQIWGGLDTLELAECAWTIDGGSQWSWNPDGGVKPLGQLLMTIVRSVGNDANCLLNVGPRPDGIIDPVMVTRLQEIGDFMRRYANCIYGTRGGPIPGSTWGATTHRGDTMFVFLAPFNETVTIPAVNQVIVSSTCLSGGTATVEQGLFGTKITMPAEDIDSLVTVIKMVLDPSRSPIALENLALGKSATQSSTILGADASRAVDGNTNGIYAHSSVTHTDSTAGAWWMVDLGETLNVNRIQLWNRTDNCCMRRLDDYSVMVLDSTMAIVWSSHQTTYPDPYAVVNPGGQQGRYVKIRLTGTSYLSLAEVQVYDSTRTTATGAEEDRNAVSGPDLRLHPNPCGSVAHIAVSLAERTRMTLGVYDVNGRRVRTVAVGERDAGRHDFTWDGRRDSGERVAAGIYLVRLSLGTKTVERKLALVH